MTGAPEGLVLGAVELLITYALHSTLLLGGAWILTRVFLRREAWREVVWKAALVGGVVTTAASQLPGRDWAARLHLPYAGAVPGALATVPNVSPLVPAEAAGSAPGAATGEPVTIAPALVPSGPSNAGASSPDGGGRFAATALHRPELLLIGWGFLALALLTRLAVRRLRLRRVLSDRHLITDGPAAVMLDDLRGSVGFRRAVRLTATDAVATPLALSGSEICVPARFFGRLGPEEQRVALAHEFAHLVRRDPAWHFAAQVFGAVFFFQPLHLVASKKLRESAELLADAWAVRETGSRLGLVRCLAAVADWISTADRAEPTGSMAMAETGSVLMARVRRLLDGEIEPASVPRGIRVVAAVVIVATAALAPAVVSRGDVAEAAEEVTEGPVPAAAPVSAAAAATPAPSVATESAATPTAAATPTVAPEPVAAVAAAVDTLQTPGTAVPGASQVAVAPAAEVVPTDALDLELSGQLLTLEPELLLAAQPLPAQVNVEVVAPPIRLDEIVVTGQSMMSERLERVGFYRRRAAGFGRFFDRRDISELGVQDLSEFFFTTPGLPRRCSGLRCGHNESGRGFAGFANLDGCEHQLFVDGVLLTRPGGIGGDITYVEAMEVYSGPSQLPPQFHGLGGACGAVVVWTRF